MELTLEKQVSKVKTVTKNKRYWFIRTFAGEAFDFYMEQNYVGLGLNHVPIKYIREAPKDDTAFNTLQSFIENNTDYKKGEATKWAKQLVSFTTEMAIGDTVIIPSRSSDRVAFGTITSDVFVVPKPAKIIHRGKEESLPEKRRSVKWNEVIRREDLQGELRGMFSSHKGITNVDDLGYIIEGAQEPLFIKDDHMYLVLKVGRNEDINAFDLERFLSGLTYFYKEFCEDYEIEANENLSIKIRLQSEGKAYLKAAKYIAVVGLAGLIMLCNNPHVEFEMDNIKFKAGSEGGLKSYNDFLDKKQEREMRMILFKDSINRLNAKENKNINLIEDATKKVKKDGE